MKTRITRYRVVPVATVDSVEGAVSMAGALCAAGLPVVEVTLRTPVALEAIRAVRAAYPDMLVGAGTVLSPAQVRDAVAAGAQFGLSPGLNPNVVRAASDAGLFFMPGVMTPSEVEAALGLGCDLLKFFPAAPVGGVAMLQALAGPFALTGAGFVPLGGVNLANMRSYLSVPCVPAVGGSWLCDRALVHAGQWPQIQKLAEEALSAASHPEAAR